MIDQKNPKYKVVIYTFLILYSLLFILPLLVIISVSLMSNEALLEYGFTILPKTIDFSSYEYIFRNPWQVLSAYKVSIITSLVSLVLYLSMASSCAYTLSRKDFAYRKILAFFLFFTMLFQGGLAPTYILMTKYLGLRNSYWALILPLLGNVWYLFIMRTFFQQLPDAIIESATIDGANEFQIYFQIILPLSKPVLATIGVMSLLFFWNSWMPALLYIEDKALYPLQYLLQVMLRNVQEILDNMDKMPAHMLNSQDIPTESVRMAMVVIAAGPMLVIFPFFQKHFVKGLTVGSVKG